MEVNFGKYFHTELLHDMIHNMGAILLGVVIERLKSRVARPLLVQASILVVRYTGAQLRTYNLLGERQQHEYYNYLLSYVNKVE